MFQNRTTRHAVGDLRAAREAVTAAAHRVLADEIQRLVEGAKAMQAELGARRQIIAFLGHNCPESLATEKGAVADYLADIVFPYQFKQAELGRHPALIPWDAMVATLQQDANAPLSPN